MSGGVVLRAATPADAEAIAAIAVRAWQHAYVDLIDPRTLAERTFEAQLAAWQGLLASDETQTVVAIGGGRIAGYATVSASPDADAGAGAGFLRALYVDPPAQGAGLGSALLEDAVARLRRRGDEEATLWVFADYGLARRFYERHGWALDPAGEGREDPSWRDPAVRYRRTL